MQEREKKKAIVITNNKMFVKVEGKKKESCLDYYLFSCTSSKREREGKKASILSFSSVYGRFCYSKAVEVITTNRNIGTGTTYNTIHTYIERPLAIFFYPTLFLSLSFSVYAIWAERRLHSITHCTNTSASGHLMSFHHLHHHHLAENSWQVNRLVVFCIHIDKKK